MNSEIDKYTISIYTLLENKFDFGLDKYTIFDEAYRTVLNNAILNYYMFREISFVNPAVWRQKLTSRLDLIMRNKYNALYKAKLMEFNPLYTMELYEDYTHSVEHIGKAVNNGETNYNSNSTTNATNVNNTNVNTSETTGTESEGLQLSSQFPSEEMTEDNLTSNLFVDNATKNKGKEDTTGSTEQQSNSQDTNTINNNGVDKTTNVTNGSTNNNTKETYSKKTIGSASDLTFAHAMTQFKEYIDDFQIDQQVIDDLKDLFLHCW